MLKRLETTPGLPGTQVLEMWSSKRWRDWAQELTHLLPRPLKGAESFDKTPTTLKTYYSLFFYHPQLKTVHPPSQHSLCSLPPSSQTHAGLGGHPKAQEHPKRAAEILPFLRSNGLMEGEPCSSRAAVILELRAGSFWGAGEDFGVV